MMSLFITTTMIVSQALFARAYGGTKDDGAFSATQTSDGSYVVAGATMSFGAGNYDFLVLKIDPSGVPQWVRTFGGMDYDWAFSVAYTSDGGYVVAGETRSFGAGYADFLIIRLASDGSLSWAKTFGGTGYEDARSVIRTAEGGYAVAGNTNSFGAGAFDLLLLKINSSGSLQWAKAFGGTNNDYAHSIVQTSDAGYVVAGSTRSFGSGGDDVLVMKLNSSGDIEWARTFGGTSGEGALCITQTMDGGYVVAGATSSFGAGNLDFLVIKLDRSGNIEWARTLGGMSDDRAWSVTKASDGGCVVTGWTYSFGAGFYDLPILKLNSAGNLQWAKIFGGAASDNAYSVIQTTDGGYAIVGGTASFGAGYPDHFVLKLNQDGNYPSCVADFSPTVTTPTLSTSSPSVGGMDCSPNTSSPTVIIGTPSLTITDACEPLYEDVEEGFIPGFQPRVTCSPVPGGLLVISYENMPIKIYYADGRVAYSGDLKKGENQISLETGIYLWEAGTCKGKVVVR